MQKLTDQELFGMIPNEQGGHDIGNASERICVSLKSVYELARFERGTFPDHLHFTASAPTERKGKKKLKQKAKTGVRDAYEKAFPKLDKAIETHLEATNGYIYEFPPAKMKIYDSSDAEEFNYFKHGSDEHIPDTEAKMKTAYEWIYNPHMRTFYQCLFWVLMAAAGLALVLLGARIFTILPELAVWAGQSNRNSYILFGCMILFFQTIGWFIPAKRMELTFEDHTPLFFFMLGSIFAWTVGYFLFIGGQELEAGMETIIYHIIKWPYLVYFAGVFVYHLVLFFREVPYAISHWQDLPSSKKEYVRVYEAEINKLHRYLRLRELWMERENASIPYWLIAFENRLKKYNKLYEKLVK